MESVEPAGETVAFRRSPSPSSSWAEVRSRVMLSAETAFTVTRMEVWTCSLAWAVMVAWPAPTA